MKISDWLSKDELATFTRRSDARAAATLLGNWALIALVFAAVATWTHPLSVLLGTVLLGGRQMGLATLMHEAGHGTFFRSPALNRICGQWLCAYPILADMQDYAAGHREHHRLAGTADDPDLPNYRAYPVTPASFRRKLTRDLTGQTGLKFIAAIFTGRGSDISRRSDRRSNALPRGLLVNALLLAALLLSGHGALYGMWVAAYLIFYPTIARIRQVAEHAGVPDLMDPDPRRNTRTTLASLPERLLFAPNWVNYHGEHHFLASAPCYNLKALHAHLQARGYYAEHPQAVAHGYRKMLQQAIAQPEPPAQAPA